MTFDIDRNIPPIEAEVNLEKCSTCIHEKYLYTREDGTKVWECDTHTCDYKERDE